MSREPSGWALVTLDYECKKCKLGEERVVSNEKRNLQPCTKCGELMSVLFPFGNQLNMETAPFKPFLDHASPAVREWGEEYVTSRSRWRERVRKSEKMGYKQGYKGGGSTISRDTLEWAEKRVKHGK